MGTTVRFVLDKTDAGIVNQRLARLDGQLAVALYAVVMNAWLEPGELAEIIVNEDEAALLETLLPSGHSGRAT